MRRVRNLQNLHDYYNETYFGWKLLKLPILIKRNSTKDGWYNYSSHKNGTPIRGALPRGSITICEGADMEPTLVHEMVHQYQAEVLRYEPDHDAIFKSICRHIEKMEVGLGQTR